MTRLRLIAVLAAAALAAATSTPAADDAASPVPVDPFAAGGRVVAGSIAFSSAGGAHFAGDGGDRTQEWSLQPGGGVFVARGLALNLLASGTWYRQGDVVSNQYELGPTVEYYLDTVGGDEPRGHGVPYVGAGLLWGRARTEAGGVESSWNSTCGLLRAGLAWMILDRVASDICVMHRFGTWEQKQPVDGDKSHGDRWTIHWGMKVFLP